MGTSVHLGTNILCIWAGFLLFGLLILVFFAYFFIFIFLRSHPFTLLYTKHIFIAKYSVAHSFSFCKAPKSFSHILVGGRFPGLSSGQSFSVSPECEEL